MAEKKNIFEQLKEAVGEEFVWHKLPKLFGLVALVGIRNELREKNLYDTEVPPFVKEIPSDKIPENLRIYRTEDGTFNDLEYPKMGAAGARFGRNFPLDKVYPDTANLMNPSPRTVSRRLMTREVFQPVSILNLLAAAWIQFQVHDWFVHREGKLENSHEIPLESDDTWQHKPMLLPITPAEPETPGRPPVYANLNSHWWDGSQIYGSTVESTAKLRTGEDGKMKIGDTALLPLDVEGVEMTGFRENWWVGLSLIHSLFVAEHNSICDALKAAHPSWNDEGLFQTARLINSALMAKIHTVEWTPAILPHPTVSAAMHINWSGIAGEDLQEVFEFLDESEILGGIVGSAVDHHSAPYSLTEEFVSVYRMHPLLPDDYTFYSVETGNEIGQHNLLEVSLKETRSIMERYSLDDLLYSFGVSHPGALRLKNYPKNLQELKRENGQLIDLASVDILRDRERGVPRYNDFRELLRIKRVESFEELTGDTTLAKEIAEVYQGDIDKVDLMVGLFAEPLLEGFGFSETAFRIFVLMASRRLKSDRFFTDDFCEEVYSDVGLWWVKENSMRSILLRHHPALAAALKDVDNAFAPWHKTPNNNH